MSADLVWQWRMIQTTQTRALSDLLLDGWEPFAATCTPGGYENVHLRRLFQKKPSTPSANATETKEET